MPAIREGRWDCEHCGTTGLLGRDMSCPKCGHRRPANVKFYLPEDAEEITDSEMKKRARAGADWVCEWCGASNIATSTTCSQCGAEKGTSPSQQVKTYKKGEVPRTGNAANPVVAPPPPPKGGFPVPIIIGVAVLLLVCGLGAFFLFRTTEATATVTGVSWERTIDVEKLETVTKEGKTIPSGGRKVSEKKVDVEEKVQTGTKKEVCGQKDLGNGKFEDVECDVPVYETRYRKETVYVYKIDEWNVDHTEKASGKDYDPSWPKVKLDKKEREGKRTETYLVLAEDTSNKEIYEVSIDDEAKWKTYKAGMKVTLAVGVLGAEIVEK